MKRILKITISFLMILAVLPISTISAEYTTGLYVTNGEPIANEDLPLTSPAQNQLTSSLNLNYGEITNWQFYFYNGSSFSLVNKSDLIFSDKITANSFSYTDQSKNYNVIELSISDDIWNGNETITYNIGQTSYTLNVTSSLPQVGIYSSSIASTASYVENVNGTNCDSLYLISTDGPISSVTFDGYSNSSVTPSDNEGVSYNAGKLVLEGIKYGNNFKIMVTFADTSTRPITVNSNYELGTYTYNDVEYSFALTHEDEENNLFITNSFGEYVDENEPRVWNNYLVAGNIQGATATVAPKELFDSISNVSCSFVQSSFEENAISVEVGSTKKHVYERDAYPITITVNANESGEAVLKTTFNIGNKTITTFQTYIAKQRIEKTIDLTTLDENSFNNMFSSYEQMCDTFDGTITGIREANIININLPAGSYSGNYIFNAGKDMETQFNIIGARPYVEFVSAPLSMQKNYYSDGQTDTGTKIAGSFQIKSGTVNINNIDFEGVDNKKITINDKSGNNPIIGADSKVGVFAENVALQDLNKFPVVPTIKRCNFSGYDYAVVSSDSGMVDMFDECSFTNCKNAYYVDARGKNTNAAGSGISYNLFVNCDNAIVFKSLPEQHPAYSWRMTYNYFINNKDSFYDFNINESGPYYFRENYYGKSISDAATYQSENNLRTVKMNKNGKSDVEIITNPCIRYPSSDYVLGIDPTDGLILKLFSGVNLTINNKDVKNISQLEIVNSQGDAVLAQIVKGGTN